MKLPDFSPGSKILFVVLNWGLGHATRSIPIIRELENAGHKLVLASDGLALELLQKEFPDKSIIGLPAYNIKYGTTLSDIVWGNFFNILNAIIKEQLFMRKYIKANDVDIIISDSRFGCFHRKKIAYIISHQLNLQSSNKLLGFFINKVNRFFLSRYNEVWIPDEEDHLLSGVLSKSPKIKNPRFIGLLSRLEKMNLKKVYDLTVILSGPEPSRGRLEKRLVDLLTSSGKKIALVRGTSTASTINYPDQFTVYNLLDTKELNLLINKSKWLTSRAGYTSVMDYYLLDKKAVLIPTPGQTEQEYLGAYLDGKYGFVCVKEKDVLNTSII